MSKVHISASILAADWGNLGMAVRKAEAGGADSVHVDIMDGHYVHNLTFGIKTLPCLKPHTSLPLIAHLEIRNPDHFIDDFARAGSDMIVVQEDTCPNLASTVQRIRSLGVQVGVALNPDRPLTAVADLAHQMDLLLIMSVHPGFGGQAFLAKVLPKVQAARQLVDRLDRGPAVGLDGGINSGTVQACVRAGADFLAIGSAVFHKGRIQDNIMELRSLINAAE